MWGAAWWAAQVLLPRSRMNTLTTRDEVLHQVPDPVRSIGQHEDFSGVGPMGLLIGCGKEVPKLVVLSNC